jgi:hypothetical protein
MTRWIIAVVVVAVAAIGVIVVVAASGSDSDSEASAAGAADPEAMTAFRDCMSEHGVEVPDGSTAVRPPGTDSPPSGEPGEMPPARGELLDPDPETQEALEACADLMPQSPGGTFFGPGAPPGAAPIPQD